MKNEIVFVCLGENPDDGVHVEGVYSTLDEAQRHMRVAFQAHKKERPDADVEWNAGAVTGHWGWFDTNCQYGFYIHGRRILDSYVEEMV